MNSIFDAQRQQRAEVLLSGLAARPPQTLLFEGGDADERADLALWWAAVLNCREPSPPCGRCASCLQVAEGAHRDVVLFDGREGSIKIESVRELRPLLGQPPAGDGFRVVIFAEAQNLTQESANALLKSLEEPRPGNVFVLLAPQRERLLETLVSRSWVVTLAWPDPEQGVAEAREWAEAMIRFWRTGAGWFERTGIKGAVDRNLALSVVTELKRSLARVMRGAPATDGEREMTGLFDAAGFRRLDEVLSRAHDALTIGPATFASPPLVLDWAATRMARQRPLKKCNLLR